MKSAEKVRTMQLNWIGRSEGALVDFAVDQAVGSREEGVEGKCKIPVFTTRVDTIFGATSVQLLFTRATYAAQATPVLSVGAPITANRSFDIPVKLPAGSAGTYTLNVTVRTPAQTISTVLMPISVR